MNESPRSIPVDLPSWLQLRKTRAGKLNRLRTLLQEQGTLGSRIRGGLRSFIAENDWEIGRFKTARTALLLLFQDPALEEDAFVALRGVAALHPQTARAWLTHPLMTESRLDALWAEPHGRRWERILDEDLTLPSPVLESYDRYLQGQKCRQYHWRILLSHPSTPSSIVRRVMAEGDVHLDCLTAQAMAERDEVRRDPQIRPMLRRTFVIGSTISFLLRDPDLPDYRELILEALRWDPLVALDALEQHGSPREPLSADDLLPLLSDVRPKVREQAIRALGVATRLPPSPAR